MLEEEDFLPSYGRRVDAADATLIAPRESHAAISWILQDLPIVSGSGRHGRPSAHWIDQLTSTFGRSRTHR